MKLSIIILFLVFWFNTVLSQEEQTTNSFGLTDDVNILNTPRFYRNYFSEYNLSENWIFRTEMQETSYENLVNSYTLIEFPLLTKYRISDKFSALLGPKLNVLKSDGDMNGISLFSTFGVQYNVTNQITVEGRVNFKLKKTNVLNSDYSLDNHALYKIRTRFKF